MNKFRGLRAVGACVFSYPVPFNLSPPPHSWSVSTCKRCLPHSPILLIKGRSPLQNQAQLQLLPMSSFRRCVPPERHIDCCSQPVLVVQVLVLAQVALGIMVCFPPLVAPARLPNIQHQFGSAVDYEIDTCFTGTIYWQSIERHWIQEKAEGVNCLRVTMRRCKAKECPLLPWLVVLGALLVSSYLEFPAYQSVRTHKQCVRSAYWGGFDSRN